MITEEQIWSYLDGDLNEAQTKEIAEAIANNKATAELFREMSAMHKALMTETLLEPSASFTNKVMASVDTAPAKRSIQPLIIFVLPVILAVVACLVYLVYNNISITYTMPSFTIPDAGHYTLYFILADIIVLAFFAEEVSDYRFNRKTYFS